MSDFAVTSIIKKNHFTNKESGHLSAWTAILPSILLKEFLFEN